MQKLNEISKVFRKDLITWISKQFPNVAETGYHISDELKMASVTIKLNVTGGSGEKEKQMEDFKAGKFIWHFISQFIFKLGYADCGYDDYSLKKYQNDKNDAIFVRVNFYPWTDSISIEIMKKK